MKMPKIKELLRCFKYMAALKKAYNIRESKKSIILKYTNSDMGDLFKLIEYLNFRHFKFGC